MRADVKLQLVAGQVYYVSEVNALANTFRQVDAERGRSILDGAELAKFVHSPVKTTVFVGRLQEAERARKAGAQTYPVTSSTQTSRWDSSGFHDMRPSSKQVGAALEAVVAVAFAVLYIVALGAAEPCSSRTGGLTIRSSATTSSRATAAAAS